jgi:uncharacterized protein
VRSADGRSIKGTEETAMSAQVTLANLYDAVSSTPVANLLLLAVALLIAGAVVGFLAGLFGIGGGTVIVPVLYEAFGWLSVPDEVRMPLCIGTSLAVIIPTSLSSFATHWKRGAVDLQILKAWLMPVIAGVFVGIAWAHYASSDSFKVAFVTIALLTAARLTWGSMLPSFGSNLPCGPQMAGYGVAIGASASLVGIGGGLVANMLMTMHGRSIQQAIATSSGIGIIVAVPGALGYVLAGWHKTGLPPLSLGFVSLIGFLLLMPTSLVTAKAGAALAHRLPKTLLERAFAAYLLVVSLRFILSFTGH